MLIPKSNNNIYKINNNDNTIKMNILNVCNNSFSKRKTSAK